MTPPPDERSQPPSRPGYDQALKWMLARGHDAFLALVAPA